MKFNLYIFYKIKKKNIFKNNQNLFIQMIFFLKAFLSNIIDFRKYQKKKLKNKF